MKYPHFVTPELVPVAFAVPVAVLGLYFYDRMRRKQLTRRLGELPVLGKVIASASPGRRLLKAILQGLALGLLVFAVARPQLEGKRRLELQGLDVAIAMDVSKSMLVDDVKRTAEMDQKRQETTRLVRARELAFAVMDELPGDRIAPIVFAGGAARSPLTEDHAFARRFIESLGPGDLPPGSNLAEVIRIARCVLRSDLKEKHCSRGGGRGRYGGDPLPGQSLDPKLTKEQKLEEEERAKTEVERGKAMVIFTDGGEAEPEVIKEVVEAGKVGIAVFLVGIGSPAGGVVYEIDPVTGKRSSTPKRGPDGGAVTSKRDDLAMRAIAKAAGDERRYLVANEEGEVDPMPIVKALKDVARGKATKSVKDMRDIFEPFVFLAFMLFVIDAAISTRRRTKYPEAR